MSKLHHSRRGFLAHAAQVLAAGVGLPPTRPALASLPDARQLAFEHTHTGERLSLVFSLGDRYLPESLGRLNHFLRDHYSGEVGNIDPQLFDLLHGIKQELGCETAFQVISGYRCRNTNSRLRKTRGGGVARQSLHMEGKAIDIRLAGVPLGDLRDAALAQCRGGVGYYAGSNFVHVDTGRVRAW